MEAKLKKSQGAGRRKVNLMQNAKKILEQNLYNQNLDDASLTQRKIELIKQRELEKQIRFQREREMEEQRDKLRVVEMYGNRREEEVLLLEDEEPESVNDVASEVCEVEFIEEKTESWTYFFIKWSIIGVIWLLFYIYFLKIQFGAVYFVMSILVGICLNTRTSPKKKGEVSAYSVFNQNCVSIDGTLKAEQFEREIRYGAGSVR